jgi:NAD(P)-dependent dehydrogenase (short-subunit alcohol dehydrogenase family)
MYDVAGKSAIVTGSAQGLGKEFAIHLLKAGAKVCISDVNEVLGAETLKELGEKYGKDKVVFVK